ncbi:anti-sigma factor antagonist [Streptomyces sp. NPDC005968]|uniref:anti-sigma factor antagonist n=1 Tax=Streptomyces sp. NPDC005968 TaxID=3154574 RepID=UPI0033C96D04
MERLTVSTRRTDDCPVVEVTGELDIATADLLDGHLHDVITRHGPARIVLDLSGLTFCDASGLRVLVRAHHAARRCHGRLHLVCPYGLTRYLLRITRLSETIPAHRTLSDALEPAGADRPHGRGPAGARYRARRDRHFLSTCPPYGRAVRAARHRTDGVRSGISHVQRKTDTMSSPSVTVRGNSRHAVVIGGSIAGLLAARALHDRFDKVTVVDRDTLPDTAAPRRGVPQSRQLHGLLASGTAALEELLPGITQELADGGAPRGDLQKDALWYLDGHLMRQAESGIIGIAPTRPLLEHVVRRRVATSLPGVTVMDACEVTGLVTDRRGDRVSGVRLHQPGVNAQEYEMPADLVVDASGRGSRAGVWLPQLGFPTVSQSTIRVDMVYVHRHYRSEPGLLDGKLAVSFTASPGQPRSANVLRQEGGRFALALTGMLGEEPPTDPDGMLAFAESLGAPQIVEIMKTAEPLSEPAKMRYPQSVRRHYEKVDRHPEGLVILGDALCSFNPVYGQGMSVAAMEAVLLSSLLREGVENLPRRFHRSAAKLLDTPWALSAGGDLRFPEVEGKRTPIDKLMNRYLDRYRRAATVDAGLGRTLLGVINLLEPPTRLLSPSLVLRTLRTKPASA